jgi:hypothetical protein
MIEYQRSGSLKTASAIILIAGIWTIIAPFALGYPGWAEANGIVVGILFIICSLGRMRAPAARGFSAANIVWSIWLIISPWAMAPGASLRWSSDITGIVALICAIVAVGQMPMATALPESGYGPSQRAA